MAGKDILSEYGRDTSQPQRAGAVSGGVTQAKPLANRGPVGPKTVNNPQRPGLHGTNHGNCGTQGKH